jgi:hypothetical protein
MSVLIYCKPQIALHQNNNRDHHFNLNQAMGFVYVPMLHATHRVRQIHKNALFT